MVLWLFSLMLVLQTPASSPAATPAPSGRLAIVAGTSREAIMQPSFDRLVNDVATRFARRFSVTAVPIPAGYTRPFVNPAYCNSLGVIGFIVPGRHWHMTSTTIASTVRLVIFDCDGDRFFDEAAGLTEKRNHAMIPQAQMHSIESHATETLLAKFAQFESGHRVLWARLLATGSLQEVSPAPSGGRPLVEHSTNEIGHGRRMPDV